MARQVKVLIACDFCSTELDEDAPDVTHHFNYQGHTYDLDLCEEHASEFVGTMTKYMTAGTLVEARTSRPRSGAATKPAKEGTKAAEKARRSSELAALRQWAAKNGYTVGDRGRVSDEVRKAYEAATGLNVGDEADPEVVDAEVVEAAVEGAKTPEELWEWEQPAGAPVRNPDGTPAG